MFEMKKKKTKIGSYLDGIPSKVVLGSSILKPNLHGGHGPPKKKKKIKFLTN